MLRPNEDPMPSEEELAAHAAMLALLKAPLWIEPEPVAA